MRRKNYHGPIEATVDILNGRWKLRILQVLRNGTLRFGQIEKELSGITPNITERMLTKRLRELESEGLVPDHGGPERGHACPAVQDYGSFFEHVQVRAPARLSHVRDGAAVGIAI